MKSQNGFASASPIFILSGLILVIVCAAISWSYLSKWIIIPVAAVLAVFSVLSVEANIITILLAIVYLVLFKFIY